MACESVGLPVPGQLGLVTSAYLAGTLGLDPVLLALVGALAHVSGSLTAFALARRLGRPRLLRLVGRWDAVARGAERAEVLLHRWAAWGVLTSQLVPYMRDYVGYAAGLAGVATASYIVGLVPASLLWAGVSVLVGRGADRALSAQELAAYLADHTLLAVAVALAVLAAALWLRKLLRVAG